MEEFKNLERVPSQVKKKFVPFLRKFFEACPRGIHSVAIYGSATGINYIPGKSDINSVIIMDQVGWDLWRQVLRVTAEGIKQRITAPLLLTKEYIQSSLDTFPIEFLDIKENHVSVYGEDYFSGLSIESRNLRIFCEYQMKGKLIRIRQAYLEEGLKDKMLGALMTESLSSLIPVFRNLIRIKGQTADIDKIKIIIQVCSIFHLDPGVFLSIHKQRTLQQRMSLRQTQELMEMYIRQLEQLITAVDHL